DRTLRSLVTTHRSFIRLVRSLLGDEYRDTRDNAPTQRQPAPCHAHGPGRADLKAEYQVGRANDAIRNCDALGGIALQKRRCRTRLQYGRKLPAEIAGIADAGIHPLSPCRAVDMAGIAEQKCAGLAKCSSDAMMHVVGREPVDSRGLESRGVPN